MKKSLEERIWELSNNPKEGAELLVEQASTLIEKAEIESLCETIKQIAKVDALMTVPAIKTIVKREMLPRDGLWVTTPGAAPMVGNSIDLELSKATGPMIKQTADSLPFLSLEGWGLQVSDLPKRVINRLRNGAESALFVADEEGLMRLLIVNLAEGIYMAAEEQLGKIYLRQAKKRRLAVKSQKLESENTQVLNEGFSKEKIKESGQEL